MAVPEQTPYSEHTGNGVTKSFALNFDCESKDHLIVLVDEIEPPIATWSLIGGNVVFTTAPISGSKITIQRNTPFSRSVDYQSYNNSFRPQSVNGDFDRVWWKLQELGVADWILGMRIDALKNYVDRKDDELKAYLMEEIRKQGVALDQLDEYYNYLMQRLAQIAVDKGWDASFVVYSGVTQERINDGLESIADMLAIENPKNGMRVSTKGYYAATNLALAQPWCGGATYIYVSSRSSENDGFLCIDGWTLIVDATTSPLQAGALGNDVHDDTIAIQKVVNALHYVDMRGKDWKITATINIPSYRYIDMAGANLNAEVGDTPMFKFATSGEGLTINHGGGVITGTAKSFLYCEGATDQPTTVGHSARQIRLEGLYVVGENIEWFMDWQKAVRQVFFDKCQTYTKNCINANGKCIEIEGSNCIFFGATNDVTSSGFKLRATGGTRYYCEGFHFSDCTIDNFGITFDVADIYAMNITGGFIGCLPIDGCYVAKFIRPTGSTSCRDIKFSNVNIFGPIAFGGGSNGYEFQAIFNGCAQQAFFDIGIEIQNNCSAIQVSNHRFHTPNAENSWGVVCTSGNTDIKINDIYCSEQMGGGVQIKGTTGGGCSVRNISYDGAGEALYIERAVLLSGIPAYTSATASYLQKFNTASIEGNVTVGSNITTVQASFAKGETGNIVCELSYSGATSGQTLRIVLPEGIVVPSGSEWNSEFIPLTSSSGHLSIQIPYRCTQDVSLSEIAIKNNAGATIYIDYHGFFGIKRTC